MLRLASTLRAKGQMDECRLTVERASRVLYVGTRDATGDRRHNATLNHNRSRCRAAACLNHGNAAGNFAVKNPQEERRGEGL